MENVFDRASSFNQPLNSWNVSTVTNMKNMFRNASSFNQKIDSWDVSSVIDMSFMFYQAEAFNQPLFSWNVSSVYLMDGMFFQAKAFNQDINSWKKSEDINPPDNFFLRPNIMKNIFKKNTTYRMFEGASSFDKNNALWHDFDYKLFI